MIPYYGLKTATIEDTNPWDKQKVFTQERDEVEAARTDVIRIGPVLRLKKFESVEKNNQGYKVQALKSPVVFSFSLELT